MKPTYGTVRGGTVLSLEITNVHSSKVAFCRFNYNGMQQHSERIRASAVSGSSNNQITCTTPRSTKGIGNVTVSISMNGIHWSNVTSSTYQYVKHTFMNNLIPKKGTYNGKTEVTLYGQHLFASFSNANNSNPNVYSPFARADSIGERKM